MREGIGQTLSYREFCKLARHCKRVAVYKEINSENITPVRSYSLLERSMKHATLLESMEKRQELNGHSYLCFNPMVKIKTYGKKIAIEKKNEPTRNLHADPFHVLRNFRKAFFAETAHPLSGFLGGAVGFLSYDGVRLIEKIPDCHENKENIPDILFYFYNDNIVFDHKRKIAVISSIVEVHDDLEAAYNIGLKKVNDIAKKISEKNACEENSFIGSTGNNGLVKTDLSDEEYIDLVKKAKKYIEKGDVFQVVLSRKFYRTFKANPFDIYRALRVCAASPYMFYLNDEEFDVVGASPEKLITINDRLIEVAPLAGTVPVMEDEKENDRLGHQLQNDPKETAEHMMLVDLARNDVGRVSEVGSVTIRELKQIKRFSHVMHLSSTVQGRLANDKDAVDGIKAAFPAGTLTGAPKIRAMEIIDELENSKRGMYGGTIFSIDNKGNLNSCIAIRMGVLKAGVASIRAGAGIVHDSVPESEALETRHKASSVLNAIALAEGETK